MHDFILSFLSDLFWLVSRLGCWLNSGMYSGSSLLFKILFIFYVVAFGTILMSVFIGILFSI